MMSAPRKPRQGHRVLVVGIGYGDEGAAMALARRFADTAGADLAPVHADPRHRRPGSVARELIDAARGRGADLIVLGAGRTALHVVHSAHCAVAVAPDGYDERGSFRHLGVAYDGTAEADGALQAAYDLAARDRAAVTLYWTIGEGRVAYAGLPSPEVDTLAQAARREAQDALDAAADSAPEGVNPETVLLRGDPARDIPREADGVVDLLVVGARRLGPLHRALTGSVSDQLLLGAAAPVLVVPGGQAA
jgi:nucleotide-binding universal stress UspA family protein